MDTNESKKPAEFSPSMLEQIRLLWLHTCSPSLHSLSKNIVREVCDYFRERLFLVGIYKYTLKQYWLRSNCCVERRLPESIRHYRMLLLIGSDALCIHCNDSAQVSSISLSTGEIKQERPMLDRRCSPGVAKLGSSIYVFSGYQLSPVYKQLTTCERYDIKTRSWQQLPRIPTPGIGMYPVQYKQFLILPNLGTGNGLLAYFDIESKQFVEHCLYYYEKFPYSMSFLQDDDLVLISPLLGLRLRVSLISSDLTLSTMPKSGDFSACASEAIQLNDTLYWVNELGHLVSFSLQTFAFPANLY